jgi:hypothetical protein
MLALTGLLAGACAGNLENPERFEQGFNPASPDGGTETDGNTGGDVDAAAPNGNGGNTGADNSGSDNTGNGGPDGGATTGSGNGAGNSTDADGGAGNGGSTGAPKPSCDVAPIFTAKCANSGCHGSAGSAAGLDLASPNVGTRLRDKTSGCDDYLLIDTAAPENSFLYLKVSEAKPACGSRMPFGVVLTADEQACILKWAESL